MRQNSDQPVREAAQAGLVDKLAEMLAMDASLIDARGMDGRTPLHCAGTAAVAALLLDHGARIDARDEDHNSTPARWRIGESPGVMRFCWSAAPKRIFFWWQLWVIWRWRGAWSWRIGVAWRTG
ncbi:MAG: hypothetical protein ACKV2U_21560, partial [Bryobacteraceae bacterium]